MKTTMWCALGALAVLTCSCLAGPPIGLNPFSRVNSREEAVQQFAGAEENLNNQVGLQELFDDWKEEYGITYPEDEEAYRLDVFESNVRLIIASNRNPNNQYWTGLTKFAAMTNQEFQDVVLLSSDSIPPRPHPSRGDAPQARSVAARAYPAAKDWSAEGNVTPVRNQGTCGSCWAFAGAAAIEAQVKIATGVDYDFSEQQLVDCQTAAQACAGGWLDHPLTYATSTPLVTEAAYPYNVGSCSTTATCSTGLCPTSTNGCRTCKTDKIAAATTTVKLSGYSSTTSSATKEVLMQAVTTNGPLAIAIQASDFDFQFYKGGILTKPQGTCGSSVNHAVLLVGYNSTGDTPYWRIKNSWGTGWGNQGYIDISMITGTVGSCQMYQYGGYFPIGATVSDTSNICAGVSCPDTACKTGGSCDPATGQCTYSSFPTGPCTTSDNRSGQCDGQGTCQATAGLSLYGIFWVGEVNRDCAAACQAAGNRVPLSGLCSQSPTIIYPGTISSATCRGVKSTFSTYAITSGFGCGCINQGAQWTAGVSGACPAEAPNKQTFVCRTTSSTGTFFGWTTTRTINKVPQVVCTINVKDFKGRDTVAYRTAFDYLCTALPAK